ncbi:MAG: 30S ribosomal protein S5 [Candidatus Thermoplasmatota archaeon]
MAELSDWIPKTTLGRLVKEGKIKTMSEALRSGFVLREHEIVDTLLPNLKDEVINVRNVQRMTDSGRRMKFAVMVAVGNEDGFVGLGVSRGREVGPEIKKAINAAKLNMIEVVRGCGSWECGCGKPHTLPYKVVGRGGSVRAIFKPAPRGVSLAIGDIPKIIFRLAGIKDAWGVAKGQTKTTVNYALAAFDALRNTATFKLRNEQIQRLKIRSGAVGEVIEEVVGVKNEHS